MNDLRNRLDRLANAAADGIDLTRPDAAAAPRRPWWRTGPALAAAAAVVVAAAGTTAVLVGGGGGDGADDDVAVGDDPQPTSGDEALVAVTYGDASTVTQTWELHLRFIDASGTVIADRAWNHVTELDDGSVQVESGGVEGGLLQRVPAGDLRLEATLARQDPPATCAVPFTAAPGQRLILRLQADIELWTGSGCAGPVQSVEDWVEGRTGPMSAVYLELTHADAVARAQSDGFTTRVVAMNGVDLPVTLDLRPDRLNLMLFDGIVVAAQLDGEQAVADPPDLRSLLSSAGT